MKTKFKDTEIGMIPEDWGLGTLKDITIFSNGKSSPERTDRSTFKVFGSNGVIGKCDQFNSQEGTIIIGRVGSYCGSVYYSIRKCWVTDNAIIGRARNNSDSKFIYYLLKRLQLNRHRGGSGQPLLNQAILNSIKTPIIEKNEQVEIAKILSDLDSKIELLQKQNKTLEDIAQALFKHWFVDFEFPDEGGKPYKSSGGEMVFNEELGKEIPKRWGVKSLDEIADYLNGLALQKYPPKDEVYLPVIKIKELRQGITTQSDKANPNIDKNYIINNGDILFSWSGSLMVVIWGGGKGALNQHLFKVTSKNFEKWFYYYWTKRHLEKFIGIAKDKATTMGHIKRKHLAESKVLVPNKGIMEKMNKIIEPVIYKIISNKVGVIRFQKTRDLLLPKLMSGEVRIDV